MNNNFDDFISKYREQILGMFDDNDDDVHEINMLHLNVVLRVLKYYHEWITNQDH